MSVELLSSVGVLLAGFAGLFGFLWSIKRDILGIKRDVLGIKRDISGLCERMARIEGWVEGLFEWLAARRREAPPIKEAG